MSTSQKALAFIVWQSKRLAAQPIYVQLILLIAIGFGVRILVNEILLGGIDRPYEDDESGYITLALHLSRGLGFTNEFGYATAHRTPGLPLLLTIPVSIFGSNIAVIRCFMCFVEAFLAPALYLLLRSMTISVEWALAGSMLTVLFPTWVIPSGAILTDIPAAILVAVMTALLITGYKRQSSGVIAGAGVVWGAAILIRAVSLIYLPALFLWLFLSMEGWRRKLASLAVLTMCVAVVLAPWCIRNEYLFKTLVLTSTQAGSELNKSNNPQATGILAVDNARFDDRKYRNYNEAVQSKLFQADAVEFIRTNPWRFIELCWIRFGQLWKLYSPRVPLVNSIAVIASFGLAVPFFLLQVFRAGWRRGPDMLLFLIIACHTAAHVIFTSIVRYRVPVEPLIITLAVGGFCWTIRRLPWWREVSSSIPWSAPASTEAAGEYTA
jgi:4-amino-4-deoxy-L-arabinose transferase-like glycosyltransferase